MENRASWGDYIYHALERVALACALLGEEDEFEDWARRARIELRVLGSIAVGKSIFTDEQWGKALLVSSILGE
jgi:hypothetical protein